MLPLIAMSLGAAGLMACLFLLFRILLAAFVLLPLTVLPGLFFFEELFGEPFRLTHKNVFAILSWFIFGGLLAGHFFRGVSLARLRRYPDAVVAWQQVIAAEPDGELAQKARRHMRTAHDLEHIFGVGAA